MTIKILLNPGNVYATGSFSTKNLTFDADKIFWAKTTGNLGYYGSSNSGTYSDTFCIPFSGIDGTTLGVMAVLSCGTSGYSTQSRMSKTIVDDPYIVISGGTKICRREYVSEVMTVSSGATNISWGLNGKIIAIYISGVVAATSTIDVCTGSPWFYPELIIDKGTGKAKLKVNGTQVCLADLPGGFVADTVSVSCGRGAVIGDISPALIAEVIVCTGAELGPVKSTAYVPVSHPVYTFTGIYYSPPWTTGSYRTSETLAAEDRYSYETTSVLPSTVTFTSIKAMSVTTVAAASSGLGGQMNVRIRVGATNYDESITSLLTSTTPIIYNSIKELSPATGVAWTQAELRAIQTGYVIAP